MSKQHDHLNNPTITFWWVCAAIILLLACLLLPPDRSGYDWEGGLGNPDWADTHFARH